MSKLLSKHAILAAADLPTKDVDVPEWGGTIRLRAWSAGQRDAFEATCAPPIGEDGKPVGRPNTVNFRARLLAATAIDEAGDLLFSPEEVEQLTTKSGLVLDRLLEICQVLHGMTSQDVKTLEGNSNAAPSASSPTS
jgi:hypothetical protein